MTRLSSEYVSDAAECGGCGGGRKQLARPNGQGAGRRRARTMARTGPRLLVPRRTARQNAKRLMGARPVGTRRARGKRVHVNKPKVRGTCAHNFAVCFALAPFGCPRTVALDRGSARTHSAEGPVTSVTCLYPESRAARSSLGLISPSTARGSPVILSCYCSTSACVRGSRTRLYLYPPLHPHLYLHLHLHLHLHLLR